MTAGYCKKCKRKREFVLVDEKFGSQRWECVTCGNPQLGFIKGD